MNRSSQTVRYKQLPSEAEVFRLALAKSVRAEGLERDTNERKAFCGAPSPGEAKSPLCKARLNIRRGLDVLEATTGVCAVSAEQSGTVLPLRNTVVEKNAGLPGSKRDPLGAHPSNVLLSTNELADLTGFAPKTIRRWASRRLLNFIRVWNRIRFRPASVELFLTQHEVQKSKPNSSRI